MGEVVSNQELTYVADGQIWEGREGAEFWKCDEDGYWMEDDEY